MADGEIEVEVLVQIGGEDLLAGRLWSHRRRAVESATFSYAPEYLAHRDAYELDPALPLSAGAQQTPVGRAIFGALSDCAPDRWGRRLMQRAEHRRAGHGQGVERSFGEIDYLLGVRDDLRQGALRLRDPADGSYLADERSGVPQLLDLPRLLNAAERLEREEEREEELRTLLRGGSSLGGARPKAHVRDRPAEVAIAKFPRPAGDEWDVIRWEAMALDLAREAGIAVPARALHIIDGQGGTDPHALRPYRRRHGAAHRLCERDDDARGRRRRRQGSYLDIAEVIERHSPAARADLRQLWRRIAFSILISNTDDHLRNHGFLRADTAGWSLAPAFDLNPDPRPGAKHLCTAIDYDTTAARLDVLMAVAEHFRLGREDARAVLREVAAATAHWRQAARRAGLDRTAIEQMAPAFEHEQARLAREI